MWQGIIETNIEDARDKLLDSCRQNPLLSKFGFRQTKDLLVQVEGDAIVLRHRSVLGKATCPAMVINLYPRGNQTAFTASMKLGSAGLGPLFVSTAGLSLLIGVCFISILVAPLSSLPWGIGIFFALILSFLWIRVLASLHTTKLTALQHLKTVWLNSSSSDTQIQSGRVYQIVPQERFKPKLIGLSTIPTNDSLEVVLNSPAAEILQHAESYKRTNQPTVPEKLGFSGKPVFALSVLKGSIIIKRIRPSTFLTMGLLSNFAALDFALRLRVKVVPNESGSTLRISASTTLLRKFWTVAAYTIGFLLVGAGALFLFFLVIPTVLLPAYLPLFTVLVLTTFGGLWIELEMNSSDKTEYLQLLGELGELLAERGENSEINEKIESLPKGTIVTML